jgi:uncharacterized membrane protein AbrB (regulator of aidB expression)
MPAKPDTFLASLTPRFFRLLATGLVIGMVGGFVAHVISMPLAWMMGPMLATFIFALLRVPMAIPMKFRAMILGVIGVFLGGSFTPDTIDQAARLPSCFTYPSLPPSLHGFMPKSPGWTRQPPCFRPPLAG